jgi:O-antigen ligase
MSLALRGRVSGVGWDGGIVALTAFVAPLLSIYAPLGMAPLFAASALALLFADMIRSHGWPQRTIDAFRQSRPLRLFALLCLLLCLWALASTAWAVEPAQALASTGQVFGIACAVAVYLAAIRRLNGEARRVIMCALLVGVFCALAFLLTEILDNAWLGRRLHNLTDAGLDQVFSRYNRGLTVLLLLICPALLALRGAVKRLALGLVAFAVVMAYYGSSLQLAAIAALLAILLALLLPRATPWLIGAVIALFVAAAPLLPPLTAKTVDTDALTARTQNMSIAHRIIIWRFSAERIADKPLAGWGMNAARAIPGGKDKVILVHVTPPIMGEKLPLHTHNAPLQWWLELGVPGAVLMAGLWLFALRLIAKYAASRAAGAIATGGFSAAFVIANLSFGAWQSWWLATLGLAAALIVLFLPSPAVETT